MKNMLELSWSQFKSLYTLKSPVPLQHRETENAFEVFFVDGTMGYWAPVYKVGDPAYNETTYTEWVSGYQSFSNRSTSPKTADFRPRLAQEKPSGSRATQVTFNWCDKTTWYPDAARVIGETPTEPVSEVYYQLAHTYVIDTYHGKIMGEDFLKDASNNSYRVAVTVDGVAKVEQDPHTGSGGDYTVDYVNGRITPISWSRGTGAVLVTYFYAQTSKFWVKPPTGCKLVVNQVECQFSSDIQLTDTAIFQPRGLASSWAPQLGLPAGTKIPLGNPLKYKTMRNFYDDAMRSYPSYPALGGNSWRGSSQPATVLDWDYTRTTDLSSATGMDIEVRLEHDVPFGGEYATVTFYCDAVPE